jgi:hypothetical protein
MNNFWFDIETYLWTEDTPAKNEVTLWKMGLETSLAACVLSYEDLELARELLDEMSPALFELIPEPHQGHIEDFYATPIDFVGGPVCEYIAQETPAKLLLGYFREERQVSVEEVSRFTGFPLRVLNEWEEGVSRPGREHAKTLARMYDLGWGWFEGMFVS